MVSITVLIRDSHCHMYNSVENKLGVTKVTKKFISHARDGVNIIKKHTIKYYILY